LNLPDKTGLTDFEIGSVYRNANNEATDS